MFPYPRQTEKEATIADAQSSLGKTEEERIAMFVDLLRTIDVLWTDLTPQELERRREIHRRLNAKPVPWWKNMRPQAWPIDDAAAD
jgi:hypothetical protein